MGFSIPAQPLASALRSYGDATGREAIYDATLAHGRMAGEVDGVLTPTEGLRRLLAGTGLAAHFVAEGAFILSMAPPAAGVPAVEAAHRRYYALIQAGLLDMLCRQGDARPGHYRIIAEFRIAPSGAIEDMRRIGSTGLADTDRKFEGTLRSVRFDEPPPSNFAQPVRILIVPDTPGAAPACARGDGRLRAGEVGR